jgi:EmrB/QacA subfamily drug resistance transporter
MGSNAGGSSPAPPWTVFCIACVAVFLVSLDGTMLFSMFGTLRTSFAQSSATDLSWVLNAYTIVYAAVLIPAGGLADRYGRKRVFIFGLASFIAASAACGLSVNVPELVFARIVQAIGGACLTPASLSLILAAFRPDRRAFTVSIWGAVGGVAAAVGPSLGSFIAQSAGWSWAFFINVPLGAYSLWRGWRLLPPSTPSAVSGSIDLLSILLLILAVGLLTLAVIEADSPAWTRSELWEVVALSLGAGVGFLCWSRIAANPLVRLDVFRNTTYSAVTAATLIFGVAFSIMFFSFFFYMTDIWHYDQATAGLAVAPGPLTVVPVAILTGRLAGRLGHRPFLLGGALLYAISGLWLYFVPGPEPAYLAQWLPALLLSGCAVGLIMPSLSGAAVSRLPPDRYAVGSAVNQAARQVGGVIGVATTVVLLGHDSIQRRDFDYVYGLHVTLALLIAFICAFVDTRPDKYLPMRINGRVT